MTAGRGWRTPPDSVVHSVWEVYERGQCLEALSLAESFAPLQDWDGVVPGTIALRIATAVGARRVARRLALRNWRSDPKHPLAHFEYAALYLSRRGPLLFWHDSIRWPVAQGGLPKWQADILALKSRVASDLRDFDAAEHLLRQAEALAPADAWVRLQRAYLLERLDQVEAALETARSAIALHPHPFYRAGVQTLAHLLQLLDRDEDAIRLLQEASQVLQNAHVAVQLYGLLSENRRWPEAVTALERSVALSPRLEARQQRWVAGQEARTAYYLGRREKAAALARQAKDNFHDAFAQRLDQPAPRCESVRLEVPFVRQHFKTCVPATQAALGRFWQLPVEHLQLVEALCYDGTPLWKQRDWSEHNGWFVRGFRVTWETAIELLERGIPFAVSTVDATSSHLQVVMGFDRTRRTLVLRDPSQPYAVEWEVDPFFERYRPFGPQGLVFLPMSGESRIHGLELPDCSLHDENHTFELALSNHDRLTAQKAAERAAAQDPDHPIVWELFHRLAAYDSNVVEESRCLDRLLELFPHATPRILQRLTAMRLASREERIEFLQKACAHDRADPVLLCSLARLLCADARQHGRAGRLVRRTLRALPLDAGAASVLADLTWHQERYSLATELYRLSATLENFQEEAYATWFSACRQIRQTEPALAHLRERFARFGKRSAQPAFTLAWALRELEQPQQAREVLREASQLLPQDGYLSLRAALLDARLGRRTEATALLNSLHGRIRENDRLRAAAEIAEIDSDLAKGLQHARDILALEPLALDAHNGVARHLAALEGRAAALAHLAHACKAYPRHCGLRRTHIEWLRGFDSDSVILVADELLRLSPGDAWTHRERAWALANRNRLEEALAAAQDAYRIEPRNSGSPGLVARILVLMNRPGEAKAQYRRAIELDVDNDTAIEGLLSLATSDQARREELSFVEHELIRQVVRGDGLLTFAEVASPLLPAETLLDMLRQALAERPDLWHSWSALVRQFTHLQRFDEALSLATRALERFPHLPRLWLELAAIHQGRCEPEKELSAAQQAFDINPAWNRSVSVLGGALERQGRLEDARRIYERALHHVPRDPTIQGKLGAVLWRLGQPEEALARLEQALQQCPDYPWGWARLYEWSSQRGQRERAVNFARKLTEQRPGDTVAWAMLARTLNGETELNERLAAIDRALSLEPHSVDNWDLKIELLADHGHSEAAVEAGAEGLKLCPDNQFVLRGRLAWVEAQSGKIQDAVGAMRTVLADNAGYVWGWQQLCLWLLEPEAKGNAQEALEHLLSLQPNDLWAQRQLAEIHLRNGDRDAAEELFGGVLRLSPTDRYAAERLFAIQLEFRKMQAAEETLRLMRAHQPGAGTLACECRLHLRQGNSLPALKLLQTLTTHPDPDPQPIRTVIQAMNEAGLSRKALRIIKRALRSEECNPQTAVLAFQTMLDRKQGLHAAWLLGRTRSKKARLAAAPVLAHGIGRLQDRLALRILLWRHRQLFYQDDQAWGQVGYAMTRAGQMRATTRWMNDWRSRTHLEPWMLFNLCLAMRHTARYRDSEKVVQYALNRWEPQHQDVEGLRLFLAVEQALAGETKLAAESLEQAQARSEVVYDQQLLVIAKSLVELQTTPLESRPHQFRSIRKQLNDKISLWQLVTTNPDIRRTLRRAGRQMVKSGAGWRARLWFGWKLHWQWLLLPALPLLALLLFAAMAPPLLGVIWILLIARYLGGKR